MALALPGPSFSFIFFHLLSFLFSFFLFFSFSFISFHYLLFFHFLTFSVMPFHVLSRSFIFSFIFCRGLKICFFGLNFVRLTLTVCILKINFGVRLGRYPFGPSFPFFPPCFFLPFFFSCCFWYFSFFFIFHFHFSLIFSFCFSEATRAASGVLSLH